MPNDVTAISRGLSDSEWEGLQQQFLAEGVERTRELLTRLDTDFDALQLAQQLYHWVGERRPVWVSHNHSIGPRCGRVIARCAPQSRGGAGAAERSAVGVCRTARPVDWRRAGPHRGGTPREECGADRVSAGAGASRLRRVGLRRRPAAAFPRDGGLAKRAGEPVRHGDRPRGVRYRSCAFEGSRRGFCRRQVVPGRRAARPRVACPPRCSLSLRTTCFPIGSRTNYCCA